MIFMKGLRDNFRSQLPMSQRAVGDSCGDYSDEDLHFPEQEDKEIQVAEFRNRRWWEQSVSL